jgi:hypothetical protein
MNWTNATNAERVLASTTGFTFIYTLAAIAACGMDGRTLGGEGVWLKPLKFGISTLLYLGTLLWTVSSLGADWRQGRALLWIAATASLTALFEILYIGIQAGLGQASHFNLSTPFHAAMYSLMAIAAVALVLSGGALGLVAFLDPAAALSKPMRWGTGLAFLLSTILTITTALTMGGRLTHHVGLEPAAALRVPLTSWSLTVGDMRVPHFLATHLMQAGPLFAWLAATTVSDRVATAAVIGFCLAWAGLTLWVFRIVLGGRPFLAFLG